MKIPGTPVAPGSSGGQITNLSTGTVTAPATAPSVPVVTGMSTGAQMFTHGGQGQRVADLPPTNRAPQPVTEDPPPVQGNVFDEMLSTLKPAAPLAAPVSTNPETQNPGSQNPTPAPISEDPEAPDDPIEALLKDETAPAPAAPAPAAPAAPTRPEHRPRDFSGLTEEEIELFKNMNRPAFDRLKPMFIQYKEREVELSKLKEEKAKLDSDLAARGQPWYEHEHGYQLAPEYGQYVQAMQDFTAQAAHWREQLVAIEDGKDFYPLLQDPQTGRVFVSQTPEKPTAAAKIEAQEFFNAARQNAHAAQQAAAGFKQQFTAQHKEYVNRVSNINDNFFKKYEKSIAQKRDAVLAQVPSFWRNDPRTIMAANALALAQTVTDRVAAKNKTSLAAKTAASNPTVPLSAGGSGRPAPGTPGDLEAAFKQLDAMVRG